MTAISAMASAAVRALMGHGLADGQTAPVGIPALYVPASAPNGTAGKPVRVVVAMLGFVTGDKGPGGGMQPQPRARYMITLALAQPGETVTGGVTDTGAVERMAAGDQIVCQVADLPGVRPDDSSGPGASLVTFQLSAKIRTQPGVCATCEVSR